MLRFYAQRTGSEYIIIGDSSKISERKSYSVSELNDIQSAFCEIKVFPEDSSKIIDVVELDVEFINPEALKAAHDNNLLAVLPETEEKRAPHAQSMRFLFKEVIDRVMQYDDDFVEALSNLFMEYPVDKIEVPEGTKIIG
jgi:hypothetical protein